MTYLQSQTKVTLLKQFHLGIGFPLDPISGLPKMTHYTAVNTVALFSTLVLSSVVLWSVHTGVACFSSHLTIIKHVSALHCGDFCSVVVLIVVLVLA